ncbi:hypothetical protein OKW22_000847 [Bacilli bacterium PM5-3]|nr:hypothetical protein [Bacilli bacterium PM5-3]MDH6603600.1 hypothetical protein [Bacilli bacterium PM5-9]
MLKLRDLLKNTMLSKMELVIENANLDTVVTNVGVVDYEFDISDNVEKDFNQSEFLISSMLVAKNDEEKFYEIIKKLIEMKTCSIAIKKVYYDKLPEKVYHLARQHNYPIFMYDDELTFEDVIYEVLYEIKKIERINYYQQVIDNLLSDFFTNQKAFELLNIDNEDHYIFALKVCEEFNISILKNANLKIFEYYDSYIIFATMSRGLEYYRSYFEDILKGYDYYIGISYLEIDLKIALKRSIDNLKLAKFLEQPIVTFNEINFLYVVIDNYQNEDYQKYMNTYLMDVFDDQQLLDTLINYVRYEGNIKKCAKEMYVHENTIRYRVNKAHELLERNSSELEFYKSLSLAITIYALTNSDFVI